MSGREKPGYNSVRVQKAYRINGIEAGRLERQIQLLDRQKLHTVRLVNQNIRLTKVTLEHIAACSGRSIDDEGFASIDAYKGVDPDKPLFMYGERQVSRRVNKVRRTQSALVKGKQAIGSAELDAEGRPRPRSSMPKFTFSQIEERVQRQLNFKADWDPNVDIAEDFKEQHAPSVRQAWASDLLPLPLTGAITEPLYRQSAVSWKMTEQDSENHASAGSTSGTKNSISATLKDNLSVREDNSEKNFRRSGKQENSSSLNITAEQMRKAENDKRLDDRRPNRSSQDTPSTRDEELDAHQTRSVPIKGSAHGNARGRHHPITKLVTKARLSAGRSKKYQGTHLIDPALDQARPLAERARKQKLENLEHQKVKQQETSTNTNARVAQYLMSYPAPQELEVVNDPLVPYNRVRQALIDKQISLVSRAKDSHSYQALVSL